MIILNCFRFQLIKIYKGEKSGLTMQLSVIGSVLVSFYFVMIPGEPVTDRTISSNHVFNNRLSSNLQNRHGVNKPSKLRLYLQADLARAAAEMMPHVNCDSTVTLQVHTRNCTCTNYPCQRYMKIGKKPRIFQRSCDDVCCGKHRLKGKSLNNQGLEIAPNEVSPIRCGEIMKDKDNKLMVPWMAHILSGTQDRCTGSVLNSYAVITSSNCVDQSNNATVIITDRLGIKTENFKVKQVLRGDLVKKSVILILNKPFNNTEQKYNPCLPKDDFSETYYNCHLGLSNRTATAVKLLTHAECENQVKGAPAIKDSLCVQFNFPSNENAGPGAPLLCSWDIRYPMNFQIAGVLSEKYNDILVFDNINRIQNMIQLNISKFL